MGTEKEIWTVDCRKKIYLVEECNRVIREIKDIGPLSKTEQDRKSVV